MTAFEQTLTVVGLDTNTTTKIITDTRTVAIRAEQLIGNGDLLEESEETRCLQRGRDHYLCHFFLGGHSRGLIDRRSFMRNGRVMSEKLLLNRSMSEQTRSRSYA